MVVLPPNHEVDRETDEDLGDENKVLPTKLDRGQFLAGATVDLK